jgi:hypothetical protein
MNHEDAKESIPDEVENVARRIVDPTVCSSISTFPGSRTVSRELSFDFFMSW